MSDQDLALLGVWLIAAAVCQLAVTLALLGHAAHWIAKEWRASGRPDPKDGSIAAAGQGRPAVAQHQRSE